MNVDDHMATLPLRIEQRGELDCRLGIKSSLNDIASVVALTYALYCANDKKSQIVYADEQMQPNGKKKLVLKDVFAMWIANQFAVGRDVLDKNPLLTSQLESLQVGLGLMFHLAKISYVDFPNTDTKERTGGERFSKLIKFAVNMRLLDAYLSSWSQNEQKSEIALWLKGKPSDSQLSIGLKQFLTAFSEGTQFKIRCRGQEIIFQQSGIYRAISEHENVAAKDEQEDVGPFRIFKSFVRERLHPFLTLDNNEFSCICGDDFDNYKEMVETTLDLSPKKVVLYQEVATRDKHSESKLNESWQVIYYGAPGTGKSYKIKEQLKDASAENIFRTTFHPDSDYSTFVGAYKPTMKKQYRYEGKVKATYYEDDDLAGSKRGEPVIEKVIEYSFIPQAFLNAYIRAYKTDENVYLIIEEINRGNCAQIFGDLFQLLDRDENGVSEYAIKADADLRAFLEEKLGEDNPGIKDGELCLPSNLYIYATMNTSDQSLFPIDSAFKRRWDWEYEPIKYKNTDWIIDIDGQHKYSWVSFQAEINQRVFDATHSEDKMLGDYFVNPVDGVITADLLRNKVLFYLWNDVCKDGEGDIFRTSETDEIKFSDMYGDRGNEKLIAMLDYLCIKKQREEQPDVDMQSGNESKDQME